MWLRGSRPLEKEPDGAVAERVAASIPALAGWEAQRRNPINPLAFRPERLAAGADDVHRRLGVQQRLGQRGARIKDVLAGVQHEQHLPAAQRLRDPGGGDVATAELEADRGRHRCGKQTRVGQRRQFHEPRPVGELRLQSMPCGERQPALADAAGAGQRDQPMRANEADDFAELLVAADQLAQRLRQVARGRDRARRWRGNGRRKAVVGVLRQIHQLTLELITVSGNRADQPTVRPERGAQRGDLRLQAVLLDDAAGPDARHQRVLGDDASARVDQCHQQVEGAATETDQLTVSQ